MSTTLVNAITAASLLAGLVILAVILVWLAATFGGDALAEHRIRAQHRRMVAAQAAARMDAQERTAGYVRKTTAGRAL